MSGPGGEASDAEWGQFARQYQSSGGTYIRDGTTIIYNQLVNMVPNGMQPANQPLVREIRALTRNVLVTQATNDQGVTNILIYERVEGGRRR